MGRLGIMRNEEPCACRGRRQPQKNYAEWAGSSTGPDVSELTHAHAQSGSARRIHPRYGPGVAPWSCRNRRAQEQELRGLVLSDRPSQSGRDEGGTFRGGLAERRCRG